MPSRRQPGSALPGDTRPRTAEARCAGMRACSRTTRQAPHMASSAAQLDSSFARLFGPQAHALPQWECVASALLLRELAPGETVFAQDVVHPFLYAVRQGLLKLRYLDADGNE